MEAATSLGDLAARCPATDLKRYEVIGRASTASASTISGEFASSGMTKHQGRLM